MRAGYKRDYERRWKRLKKKKEGETERRDDKKERVEDIVKKKIEGNRVKTPGIISYVISSPRKTIILIRKMQYLERNSSIIHEIPCEYPSSMILMM